MYDMHKNKCILLYTLPIDYALILMYNNIKK